MINLIIQIPEVIIVPNVNGYYITLKEKLQFPESLKKVLENEDEIIKSFELIKRITYISESLKSFLKGQKFLITWHITDLKKKYWLKLTNNEFEYGEGIINNPSCILYSTQDDFFDYIKGKFHLREKLRIDGNKEHILLFEEICRNIFFSGEHPLGYNLNERLIVFESYRESYEKELIRKKIEREKLEEKEREEKRILKIEKQKEQEKKRKEKAQTYTKLLQIIHDLQKIYHEIKINDIEKKLSDKLRENYKTLFKMDFISTIEDMIRRKDLNARIKGEYLTFIQEELKETADLKKIILDSQDLEVKDISILRGGDWKIEGNQSVFHFKVKVKNDSKYVLTNIQILLTSIPSGLIPQSDRYRIDTLSPDSFEGPTFKFAAKESCVGDIIKGIVIYTDPMGKQQTISITPFKIKYVCNLLVPKAITEENYEKNTATMYEKKITMDCILSPDEIEPEVAQILKNNNFYLLENPQKLKSSDFRKLNAYAEGKYDKEDVAISVIMQRLADKTNKLIIKAMSKKIEKIIDLLKDISNKCDPLKISSESLFPIEIKCINCKNIMKLTEDMKTKDFIICEKCGQEREVPK